jgi:hypothetical protein
MILRGLMGPMKIREDSRLGSSVGRHTLPANDVDLYRRRSLAPFIPRHVPSVFLWSVTALSAT